MAGLGGGAVSGLSQERQDLNELSFGRVLALSSFGDSSTGSLNGCLENDDERGGGSGCLCEVVRAPIRSGA